MIVLFNYCIYNIVRISQCFNFKSAWSWFTCFSICFLYYLGKKILISFLTVPQLYFFLHLPVWVWMIWRPPTPSRMSGRGEAENWSGSWPNPRGSTGRSQRDGSPTCMYGQMKEWFLIWAAPRCSAFWFFRQFLANSSFRNLGDLSEQLQHLPLLFSH